MTGTTTPRSGSWPAGRSTSSSTPAASCRGWWRSRCAALADSGAHYVFVSSISATTTWPGKPTPEGLDGQDCPSDAGPDDGDYGKLKAGCERAVTEVFGERSTIARAGLIIGPHENVGRLPWWLQRIAAGGEVLAPGEPDVPMQLVDARDLAAFMLDCGERGTAGTFNATAPTGNATFGSWLDRLRRRHRQRRDAHLGRRRRPARARGGAVDRAAAVDAARARTATRCGRADTDRTVAAGMRNRPVRETVADTWAWMQAAGHLPDQPDRAYLGQQGIDPEKEQRILAAWHAR